MSEENLGEGEIKRSLDLIQKAIITLDKKIETQGRRIEQLEKKTHGQALAEEIQQLDSSIVPPLPPEVNSQKEQEQNKEWNNFFKADDKKDSAKIPVEKNESLEENIGGKWFARIGITALILGVSFFLKYAFDNNWIGETGRIAIGIFIGLVLLGIGEKTIRKYFLYGQIITGGGIAVLYLSVFCAFNFYHLIGSLTTFFIMIIITAAGIALSLRYNALALMAVAIIGGFATPLMASTGENNQIGLLSYLILLDLAILTVAVFKKWRLVNIIGFFGTVILFLAWAEKFYTKQDLGITMLFLTLFFIIFSISSLIYNLVKKEKSTGVEQVLTLASAFVYFGASYAILDHDYHIVMGFFALILATYYFLWAFLVRNITPEDENLYGFLAFLTVGFVTLAIPIQFEQNIITISWVIEAVLLMIIGVRVKKLALIVFSIIVSALAFFRYFVLDAMKYDQNTLLIFNKIFLTSFIIIGASYVIAFIIHKFLDEEISGVKKKSLIALFVIAANFITIFSVSYEITQLYNRDINKLQDAQKKARNDASNIPRESLGQNKNGYGNNYYSSAEYKLNQENIKKIENKSSIALSIFWLIYAIILLAIGVLGKYKGVRLGGLALLILAILKLFFVDLWNLGTLYRIISSISLGIVLLAISFVYQKYKSSIKEII